MVASLVEMFGKPYHQIQKEFRRSELVLLAWRSQERSAQMDRKFKNRNTQPPQSSVPENKKITQDEPDMRKMTGAQQLAHLASLGFAVPIGLPITGGKG